MTTLFGKTPLEQLRDLDYKTESHTFSKGVIAAYYNAMEYPTTIFSDCIVIKRRKGLVYFCLKDGIKSPNPEKDVIYSLTKNELCKVKTKEVIYNLDEIFTKPSKQVRRAMRLGERKEITQSSVGPNNLLVEELYEEWAQHKMDDPKTFRIAFTPKRYLRSFKLVDWPNMIGGMIYVNRVPYSAIAFEIQGDIAFELAFISRFWDKKLKICNDLNELILIYSFYELWKIGVKRVNVGPTAGIKGLKIFKAKLPSHEHIIYSN